MHRRPPSAPLFPYTTLFRSAECELTVAPASETGLVAAFAERGKVPTSQRARYERRSEEHTSELQSQSNLVCRLLLEKKKPKHSHHSRRAHTSDHRVEPVIHC